MNDDRIEDIKKKLANIFYSNNGFMSNFTRWISIARDEIPGLTIKEARDFYQNQTLTQVFSRRISKIPADINRRPIINMVPFGRVYTDTMFFKNDKIAIIVYVDGFSRKAFVYTVNKASVDATDGAESLYQFLKWHRREYNQYPIGTIVHDDGGEFGETWENLLKREGGVKSETALIGDVLKNPIAERFNYSLRLMLEKYRETFQPESITEKAVNKIVENYNKLLTTSTGGVSPDDALKNPEEIKKYFSKKLLKTKVAFKSKFPAGSYVRTVRAGKKITDPYAKTLKANWSAAVEKVVGYDTRKQRYIVGEKRKLYGVEELLKIDKEKLDTWDMFRSPDVATKIDDVSKDVIKEKRAGLVLDTEEDLIDAFTRLRKPQQQDINEIVGFKRGGNTTGSIPHRGQVVVTRARKYGHLDALKEYLVKNLADE